MVPLRISPHFEAAKISPGTFTDWVDVYEDRLWGWQLQHAANLATAGPDAVFAALSLAVAFIEGYEVFRRGEDSDRRSKEFFKAGFGRVFSGVSLPLAPAELDQVASEIYSQLRCGLFHLGLTGRKIFLFPNRVPIEILLDATTNDVRQINIDVQKVVSAVIQEFLNYVALLRNPAAAEHAIVRAAFERAWHLTHAK